MLLPSGCKWIQPSLFRALPLCRSAARTLLILLPTKLLDSALGAWSQRGEGTCELLSLWSLGRGLDGLTKFYSPRPRWGERDGPKPTLGFGPSRGPVIDT